MKLAQLITEVAAKTKGTEGDPLTRDEVGQVVRATLLVLYGPSAPSHNDDEFEYAVHGEPDAGEA